MNKEIKNVFSFIKEVMELKNRNVYSVKNYDSHIDFKTFYERFSEIIDKPDYELLDINSDNIIFKLKYIKENKKKEIPAVPSSLRKYIRIKDKNDIIFYDEESELRIKEDGLYEEYIQYDKTIKEINRYNNLIDEYNKKYEEIYHIYKRITEYEEKIEIIFGQKLLVWEDDESNRIERYILEAQMDISVDLEDNIISFYINKEKFRGFVNEFLNYDTYRIKDINLLNAFIKEFNENIDEEDVDLQKGVKDYVNYASLENEIVGRYIKNGEEIKQNKTYIYDNCGLIVRQKNIKLWIEDLEKIIENCDKIEFLSPILNMFGIDFENEEDIARVLGSFDTDEIEVDNILFPLPSNNEQYKIVEKEKNSNMVLVQGPPGTGKSHTIANLISNYIAQGKRVIVTSEKSKALEVLREKVPTSIRSLSLSILNQTGIDKDLENSITTILKNQGSEKEQEKRLSQIKDLEEKLEKNRTEKQNVMRQIVDLMVKDNESHKHELENLIKTSEDNELKIIDIAMWLEKNAQFDCVPDTDNPNYDYKGISELFEKIGDIADDIKDNHYSISTSVDVIDYLRNNDIELHIKEIIGFNNYQIKNNEIFGALKQNNFSKEIIDNLENKIEKLSILYNYFEKDKIRENINFLPFINQVKEINKALEKNKDFILSTEEKIFDNELKWLDDENIEKYLNVTSKMLSYFDSKGNISIIDKIKLNIEIKNLNGLKYNGKIITKDILNYENLKTINDILNYNIFVERIRTKLYNVTKNDIFTMISVQENEFGKTIDILMNILNAFINFKSYVEEIDKELEKIINKNICKISYMEISDDEMKSILADLKYYETINFGAKKTNEIVNNIRDFYKSNNLHGLEKMIIAINTNQLDEYIKYKTELINEINVINQYNIIKSMYQEFMRDKSGFIRKYIYDYSKDKRDFINNNYNMIFKYHFVKKYYLLQEEKVKSLPELYEKREKLINEEKKIITDLVAVKGWYYQNQKMTPKISTSLSKWITLKNKAKGKNKNIVLRKMKEEMSIAKNAIPVWIMPMDVLIEQYPFSNEPQFDVLIMDESSQSSVFSISALARAKKVIIVGDDKQISPSSAFTSLKEFNELAAKYLKNSSWNMLLSKDISIYDIIQMMCGTHKITLTEHFRCLPEIIHYSNKEFYNMCINPLKVRNKEHTIEKPIKIIYVPNAVVKKAGVKIGNQKECERIISLIEEIANDKTYDGKTIGIIALQNSDVYIKKLIDMTMKSFGEKFIKERKIKIGNTYDFQGDERDVIILGMVISSIDTEGEKYHFQPLTKLEFDRSFNVAASRAKEQMILVHSVTLEELNPNCNRYRLLNYCQNYEREKEKEFEKKFESNFEKDIYEYLTSKNYKLIPQFIVGRYRIDFILENDNNQKIAIECDGDKYHGIEELSADLERQGILERCGWKFVRIRASEFYFNREESCKEMLKKIEELLDSNISPIIKTSELESNSSNLVWEYGKENDEDTEKLDSLENYFDDYVFINKKGKDFRYMVLYCEGVDKHEIAKYYDVSYSSVKKSLQDIADEYAVDDVDSCLVYFIRDYSKTKEYVNIYNYYKSKK